MRFNPAPENGFSLMEMAIVLTIVGLLLAGLLPTLSGQIEVQRRNETAKQLNEIRDALLGYAVINGKLPCPTYTDDPSDTNYGVAPATCATTPTQEGYLPWKTLGMNEMDPWGIKRVVTTSEWKGYWRYRVDRQFASSVTITTSTLDSLVIKDSAGNTLTTTGERPVAIIFSTGPDLTPNGFNTGTFNDEYQSDVPGNSFDDMLIWLSRPQLINRLVSAGKLP